MSDLESSQPLIDPVDRTITIGERIVVLRLERLTWEAFDEVCLREGLSAAALCLQAERRLGGVGLAEKVADAVNSYFKDAAQRDRPPEPQLGEPVSVTGKSRPKMSSVGLSALDVVGPPVKG